MATKKKDLAEQPIIESAAESPPVIPVFQWPEVFGNDWNLFRPSLRLRIKGPIEDAISVNGYIAEAGDYIGRASDGGVVVLTSDELSSHYELA